MSIASEIIRINNNIASAYTACNNKGATMPATQNSANLATCISSITGGSATLITKNITQNGTYNASSDNADGYSSVTVNVSGGSFTGINREVVNGVYKAPTTSFVFRLPSTATDLGARALSYAFYNCSGITSADLSSLTAISGSFAMANAFGACNNLKSINLINLTTVSGEQALAYAFSLRLYGVYLDNLTTISGEKAMQGAFSGNLNMTDIDLSSLTTVSGNYALDNAFFNCNSLAGVDLSGLITISGSYAMQSAFEYCEELTYMEFYSLTNITGNRALYRAFRGCTNMEEIYFYSLTDTSFGSYTNQFDGMLAGVTGCTVYFPIELEEVIGSWSSVLNGFGGTNTEILFELEEE